jgi:flagellar hook assembly protein FlgD
VPRAFALHEAYPNPFNPMTTIAYDLAASRPVRLAIYGLDGRRICTLVDEVQGSGRHEVTWTGRDDDGRLVASGTYVYRIEAGDFRQVRKMTLMK